MRSSINISRTLLMATIICSVAASVAAAPLGRGIAHFRGPHGRIVIEGGFVDPFWGPYYPYGYAYPYGHGYPPGVYEPPLPPTIDLKTIVTPKQSQPVPLPTAPGGSLVPSER
jgi:hypothetical protein